MITSGFELKTVLHSCGVADTIATSMGGRNRLCAEEFAKKLLGSQAEQYGKPSPEALITLWGEIETRLLKGQKLQGLIATQVQGLLAMNVFSLFDYVKWMHTCYDRNIPSFRFLLYPHFMNRKLCHIHQPNYFFSIITNVTLYFVVCVDRN